MTDVWRPHSAHVQDSLSSENAEAAHIRRQHVNHETAVRAVGVLEYATAAVAIPSGLFGLIEGAPHGTAETIAEPAAFLIVGVVAPATGIGLRGLRRCGRMIGGISSALGMLDFPIGTLIYGYIQYLLFSKKGTMSSPLSRLERRRSFSASCHIANTHNSV